MAKKFIVYLTAGYPSLEDSIFFMEGISDLVDAVEIGIPFSDPLADGPVIHQASTYALEHGLKLADIFKMAGALTARIGIPVYFMTYYNILFSNGLDRFIKKVKNAGIKGLIIPDCPIDEAGQAIALCKSAGVSWIPFITPTTEDNRARQVLSLDSDFVYYVSVTGITGARDRVNKEALRHIRMLKRKYLPSVPVCLGFGISSPESVKEALKSADGVIVGSALINEIEIGKDREYNLRKLREKIIWMRQG